MATTIFDFGAYVATLEDDVIDGEFRPPVKTKQTQDTKRVKFTCPNCGGSGQYRHFGKCFTCAGKGYFLTSERERADNRRKYREDKVKNLTDAYAAFTAANPGVVEFIRDAAKWSEFAVSMQTAIAQYGALTEGQLAAIRRIQAKCAERAEARKQERIAGSAEVDLTPIREMFERAVASGYKRPSYRAADLQISRAPDHGRNPGALYVTSALNDDYLGKIIGTAYSGKPAPGLVAIAADPKGEAVRYGQRTGSCSCCGRTLTNHASIELGIGPICAERWGL